jgi:hypothetical protein
MDGKRKSGTRLGLLERAQHAVEGKFPLIRRDRCVLFVGSDGLLASKRGQKKLRLRFWTGAQKEYRTALVKALDAARVPYEVGPEYELEDKGKNIDPKPALVLMGGTGDETIGQLERTPHARGCLVCKELLDQAASGDIEYQQRVYASVLGHIKVKPEIDAPACSYAGCVHHEVVSRELARALLKMVAGSKPWKDARGVPVATLPLIATKEDHPKGWLFKRQDAESRAFKHLPTEEAGTIYVRLAPKKVTVHVWIEPQYKTKHEDLDSPATIEDVLETFAVRVPDLRAWALKRYNDLKGLAEMDLDLEGGK